MYLLNYEHTIQASPLAAAPMESLLAADDEWIQLLRQVSSLMRLLGPIVPHHAYYMFSCTSLLQKQFIVQAERYHCTEIRIHSTYAQLFLEAARCRRQRRLRPQRADSAVPLLHKAVSVLMIRDSVGFAAVGVAAEKAVSAQQ